MSSNDRASAPATAERRATYGTLAGLALLYTAQGVPFGIAAEYLPIVMRESGYSQTLIASATWLQLPWQLKVLWANAADMPRARRHGARIILLVQCTLALLIASYGFVSFQAAPWLWFTLTALAALVAATQDVFVDALAVRSLSARDQGLGNVGQVSGYRIGMLAGGALLLLFVDRVGLRLGVGALATFVALAALAAFALHDQASQGPLPSQESRPHARGLRRVVRHVLQSGHRSVLVVALLFKLGIHMASSILKPMLVDAHWSKREIGIVVVGVGTATGLVGSLLGAGLHRRLRDSASLAVACVAHALACLPLAWVATRGAPHLAAAIAIGAEHLVSALGTTILFAALMGATHRDVAGAHYTMLAGANAAGIGLGGMLGGALADALGRPVAFLLAAATCLVPLLALRRYQEAARRSASDLR